MASPLVRAKGGTMRRPTLLLLLVSLAILGAMAAKSVLIDISPVRPHPSSGEFDASRAKDRLAFLLGDQRPHAADTEADDMVRNKLVMLLQSMGMNPVVRDQVACNELYKARGVSCARVRNVIAVLGPPNGKALLLNAHYDSTQVGPAAADDGIGVATMLEVASILRTKPLKRPVIFLFNEGEELGLVGARAFLADPLSRNVDSLVNMEARGDTGPVNMFETSLPNAAPIGIYSSAVARPFANSLSTDVYRLLPNYTDVNSFAERKWLTLNLAPMGNETRYHSPGDTVEALDGATLQHMGDQTLALSEALANGSPPQSGSPRIFMDVGGRALVVLPLIVGVVLLVSLLIAFGWLAWTRGGLLRGAAVVVGTLVLSAALSWVALALIGAVRQGMFWRAQPIWTHLGAYATVILAAVALLATVGRRLDVRQLRAAFWFIALLIGGAIGLVAPGGIIFFLFPPLLALIGIVAARWWKPGEAVGAIVAILTLYLTWGEMLALLEELLNGGPMWIFAPLGALLILPALIEAKPLIHGSWRPPVLISAVPALVVWVAAAAVPAYSADRQQRFVIEHVTDAGARKAWWSVINDRAPLPGAYDQLGKWSLSELPYSDRKRWLASAPFDPTAKPPSLDLVGTVDTPKGRSITVRLHSNGAAAVALLAPENADISAAGVAGFVRPIDRSTEHQKYYVTCFGRSCDGLTLQIATGNKQPIKLLLIGSTPALPPAAAPLLDARPQFARPQYTPNESVVFTRVWL